MEKTNHGPVFDKPYVIDGVTYTASLDGTSVIKESNGVKTIEVFKGPYTLGVEVAGAVIGGANIVIVENANIEAWARQNCEKLEDVVFDELEGKPRYRINSNFLTKGGHFSEPVYKRSTLSMQPVGFQKEGVFGMSMGIGEYSIFVAKDNISLSTFFMEHLPLYSKDGDKVRHLVFVVPPGGEATIKEAMVRSGLSKKLKTSVAGKVQREVTGYSGKRILGELEDISRGLSQEEAVLKSRIEDRRSKEKEKRLFETPRPDRRKVDLGWKENSVKEKAKIARVLAGELRKNPGYRLEIIEKAKVLTAAGDRMRKCPFTPSGVGVEMEDLLADDGMTTSDLQIKNTAIDILSDVWKDAPDVVRSYIIAASDLTALPHLRMHSEVIWKSVREARTDMQEFRNYLGKKGRKMPERYEPEFIAQMVYYAFPEITQNNPFRYSVMQNDLRKDVGENAILDREKFDLILLERAAKLYPKDNNIAHGLEQLRKAIRK